MTFAFKRAINVMECRENFRAKAFAEVVKIFYFAGEQYGRQLVYKVQPLVTITRRS